MPSMKDQLGDTPYESRYPSKPGHVKGSDTSKAAADSMAGSVSGLRGAILDTIRAAGAAGKTCDELEQDHGRHQTVSARVRELVLGGKIKDSGTRRKTRSGRSARVYVVA